MPVVKESGGKRYLELTREELEAYARDKGWMPPAEEPLPEVEAGPAERLADLSVQRQAKVDRLARQFGALDWTLSRRADEAARVDPDERFVHVGCTANGGPYYDREDLTGQICPGCGNIIESVRKTRI